MQYTEGMHQYDAYDIGYPGQHLLQEINCQRGIKPRNEISWKQRNTKIATKKKNVDFCIYEASGLQKNALGISKNLRSELQNARNNKIHCSYDTGTIIIEPKFRLNIVVLLLSLF